MTHKLSKYEKIQLRIDIEDIQIIRRDIYELIEYERSFQRERNARYRLMERVLAAGLKVIDLWEDKIHHMRVIDKKELEKVFNDALLYQKIGYRLGMEEDNENLRNEIARLEAALAQALEKNRKRDEVLTKVKTDFKDAHVLHAKLGQRVKMAQNQSTVLKSALETGFAELEEVINMNSQEFEAAEL